jgi:hypothetical protein
MSKPCVWVEVKSMKRLFFAFSVIAIAALLQYSQSTEQKPNPVSDLIKEATAFEIKLIESLRKGDRTALEQMIADGFVFIHSTGAMDTRDEYIRNASSGSLLMQRTEVERFDDSWRSYGNTVIRYSRSVMRNPVVNTENRMRNIAVYVKSDGRWQWASGQSTKLPIRPKSALIDARRYDDYVGQYQIGGGRTFTVTKENGVLFGLTTGRTKAEMIPSSENTFVFFNENSDFGFMEAVFNRDQSGKTAEVILRLNGQEVWRAKR